MFKITGSGQKQSLNEFSSFNHRFMLMQKSGLHILFPKFVKKSKKILVQLRLEYILSEFEKPKVIEQ